MENKAEYICKRHEQLRLDRYNFENQWQNIVELVRPTTSDFNRHTYPGDERNNRIYDGTARYASIALAAGLQSYLTNSSDRWFNIAIRSGSSELRQHEEAAAWLEEVADIIFAEYAREESNLAPSLHEAYLDLGAFGTTVVNQEWDRNGHLLFRTFPLARCFIDENEAGSVDTLIRMMSTTTRQLFQRFKPEMLPREVHEAREKKGDKQWAVTHAVYPRSDRDPSRKDRKNKPFASCWVLNEKKTILDEGGYDEFPYHVPRWAKIAHELYGRSPAMECLPNIKLLNAMKKTTIRAAQKIADPPLQATSDGFVMPIATHPGAMIFREPGTEPLIPLETRANIPVSLEMMESEKQFIMQCFYFDWFISELKKERQSVPEIYMRKEEKLQQLAPIVNRLEVELLSPMVIRSFNLLRAAGRIPPSPPALQGAKLKLSFVSPASRAQLSTKAAAVNQWLQSVIPMAQADPRVLDRINFDEVAEGLADWMNVPRRAVRTDAEVEGIRAERAEAEQASAMAGAAEPVSKAILNVAKAREAEAALI